MAPNDKGVAMVESEAQKRATRKYKQSKVTQLNVALFPSDQDIIDHLAGMENKAAYIRELIRKDMKGGD